MDGDLERTHIRTTATRHNVTEARTLLLRSAGSHYQAVAQRGRRIDHARTCVLNVLRYSVRREDDARAYRTGCALPSDLRIEQSYHSRWTAKEGAPEVGIFGYPCKLLSISDSFGYRNQNAILPKNGR
jgi:hypothetical protein